MDSVLRFPTAAFDGGVLASSGLNYLQSFQQRSPDIPVEDGIYVLDDVGVHFEEVALVLYGHEDLAGSVVHGYLERFGKGTGGLDVALDTEVAHDE